jgi:hypothetical protein
LIGDLISDPFHLAKVGTLGGKDLLRFLKNFEQLAQSHGPNRGQHVERDAGFGRVHSKLRNG